MTIRIVVTCFVTVPGDSPETDPRLPDIGNLRWGE